MEIVYIIISALCLTGFIGILMKAKEKKERDDKNYESAMDLTNEIIEQKGFKRINNSMWRMNDITLQNGYTQEGKTLHERILNTKKAYKVCVFGKYLCMATTVNDIDEIIEHMG